MVFQDYVDKIIKDVLHRIYDEVPESGAFFPILESFANPDEESRDKIGAYGLKVYKMPEDVVADPSKRYIEAAIYTPDRSYKISMLVGSGTKDDIIKHLQSNDFPDKLNRTYEELFALKYE